MTNTKPQTNDALDRQIIALDRKRNGFILYADLATVSYKEWLVHNMLGVSEASAMYGKPGDGKSVLAEDLALHIAAGARWHGRTVQQGAVVYIALERRKLVERRAIAFRERHGHADLPFAIVGGVYDFRDLRTVGAIIGIIRQVEAEIGQSVVLIIIDTLSRALCGGDENSSKDIGALVGATARLQDVTKAHVMWVHHMPHDGGERMRGHGALLGALDTTIHVVKAPEGIRLATVIKANDSEEGERVAFTLESVPVGKDADGNLTTAPLVAPADPEIVRQIKTTGKRWTKGLRLVHEAIVAALADGVAFDHQITQGPLVRAIYVEDARPFHKTRYVHGGDGDRAEAERKAWHRNIREARNRNLIASGVRAGREIMWLAV